MTEVLDYLDDILDGVDVGGVVVLEDGHLAHSTSSVWLSGSPR
jgi:hypothetical protein